MDSSSLPFVVLFPVLWFGISLILGLVSGWFWLQRRFPDQPEVQATVQLTGQSGTLGVVGFSRILTLSAAPSGFRLRVSRLFAPLLAPCFVPWTEVRVERSTGFLGKRAAMRLGDTTLTVTDDVADRLWRALPTHWPEAGAPPTPASPAESARAFFRIWAAMQVVIAGFLLFVSHADPRFPTRDLPVIWLFFALATGVMAGVEARRRRQP